MSVTFTVQSSYEQYLKMISSNCNELSGVTLPVRSQAEGATGFVT